MLVLAIKICYNKSKCLYIASKVQAMNTIYNENKN